MTLTHSSSNECADTSNDKPAYGGLTEFGKEVVRAMNRQGILVDISHASDKTFYDMLNISKACRVACDKMMGNSFTGTDDIANACKQDVDCYLRENLKMERRLRRKENCRQ